VTEFSILKTKPSKDGFSLLVVEVKVEDVASLVVGSIVGIKYKKELHTPHSKTEENEKKDRNPLLCAELVGEY
jgi:hypothetical protein